MLALNCSPEKEAGWGGLVGGGAFAFALLLALPLIFAEPAVAADAVALLPPIKVSKCEKMKCRSVCSHEFQK